MTDGLRTFRYDTNREVEPGQYITEVLAENAPPERIARTWRVESVRPVRRRTPDPNYTYRWMIAGSLMPPEDPPWVIPDWVMEAIEAQDLHYITFYLRQPRKETVRWRQR